MRPWLIVGIVVAVLAAGGLVALVVFLVWEEIRALDRGEE